MAGSTALPELSLVPMPYRRARGVCPHCGAPHAGPIHRRPSARRVSHAVARDGYEALVLGCIDPRLQEPVRAYLAARGLTGRYSQFTIAGAAIGVVAPTFARWQDAFWDNLAASVQMHRIRRVIAIDHRSCGASRMAFGAAEIATPACETETHRTVFTEFRRQAAERQPELAVETILMALDGSTMML